jgi:pimeloyl-ACP methyl ester carboxylesterase
MNRPVELPIPKIVWTRLLRLLALSVALFYLACALVISWNQRWFIYVPPVYPAWSVDRMASMAGLERWTNGAGDAIGMKRLSLRQPARGRVLVLYGNGSCTINSAHYADDIQGAADLDVYILEYPGYADRAGSPSQASICRAADDALQALGTNQPVYLLGESLGSGVASYLAGKYPECCAGLLLISPYDRLTGVAQEHMPLLPVWLVLVDRFPSVDYLRAYRGPVGVVVDGNDLVVPERFGLRLYENYAGPKRLWRFPESHHITIPEPAAKFWGEVLQFWQTGRPPAD